MKQPAVLIKEIYQNDASSFSIHWSDGIVNRYRLNDLQKNCPCAKCCDLRQKRQPYQYVEVPENLQADRIISIGRYALRVYFKSGCSMGIYSYAFLRELAKE